MIRKNFKDKLFNICNTIFMLLLMIIMLYPMWYVVVASLSDSNYLMSHRGLLLLPLNFNIAAYKLVAQNPNILSGYLNTIFVVVAGTLLSTFLTALGAYAMSRKNYPFKSLIMFMMVFTMYFSGGLIPRYLLINFSSLSFFTSTLKPHPADAIYTVRYSHNTRSVRRLCQGSLCQDRFPFQGLPIF